MKAGDEKAWLADWSHSVSNGVLGDTTDECAEIIAQYSN